MLINLLFDSQASAAPQGFKSPIEAAASVLDATFVDDITLNISIGYGEIQGTPEFSGAASAGPSSGVFDSYSEVKGWLAQNASADVQSGVAALPSGTTIQGQNEVAVWHAEERLMGQISANDSSLDGAAGFATDIPTNLLTGVALHEFTHVMARINYGPQPDILDLFRFSSAGTHVFEGGAPNHPSYFSLDGGKTVLADYGQSSDPSDFLNSSGRTPNDPFNEFYNASTVQGLSKIDVLEMESLGFHAAPAQAQAQVHPNDLAYAVTASGYNHFIDLINFEAGFPDLVATFGVNQSAMQAWYNQNEPADKRVASFDGLDYVASYPDLVAAFGKAGSMAAVEDAGATHLIQGGLNEHRATSFNGLDYIASYNDLIAAFGANSDAGAFHFIENGSNEHRTTTFDGLDYIASYPDLMHGFGANEQAGAAHYIDYGLHEERTTGFNVAAYEQAHPDLIGVYANDDQFLTAYINHFVSTGHYLT
jgi:hypothetical protein